MAVGFGVAPVRVEVSILFHAVSEMIGTPSRSCVSTHACRAEFARCLKRRFDSCGWRERLESKELTQIFGFVLFVAMSLLQVAHHQVVDVFADAMDTPHP